MIENKKTQILSQLPCCRTPVPYLRMERKRTVWIPSLPQDNIRNCPRSKWLCLPPAVFSKYLSVPLRACDLVHLFKSCSYFTPPPLLHLTLFCSQSFFKYQFPRVFELFLLQFLTAVFLLLLPISSLIFSIPSLKTNQILVPS